MQNESGFLRHFYLSGNRYEIWGMDTSRTIYDGDRVYLDGYNTLDEAIAAASYTKYDNAVATDIVDSDTDAIVHTITEEE